MSNPYFITSLLYLSLVLLGALDSALFSFGLVSYLRGMNWLRIHLVTLGVLTEIVFGIAPELVAARAGKPKPRFRWDIWLTLNAGILLLFISIPMVDALLINTGATLIFLAVLWMAAHLRAISIRKTRQEKAVTNGQKFYLAGSGYLLLGVFLGAGIWQGWGSWLHLGNLKEVHVHTNLWGFVALTFAGLIVDMYANFSNHGLAWPRSVTPIFWLMTAGALGLVAGPWISLDIITTLGLVLHTIATIWLLANIIKPLVGDRQAWQPGMIHLVSAYIWFLMPVVVAPLIVLNAPDFPVAQFEQKGGPILVYGWILQFSYALFPYLLARAVQPGGISRLGGNWFTLLTIHTGGIFFWLGLLAVDYQQIAHGIAFLFWAISLMPILKTVWGTIQPKPTKTG